MTKRRIELPKSRYTPDMICYEVTVPGKPVGKERPRFSKSGRAFTAPKTREFESLVARLGAEVIHIPFRDRGIIVTVECYFSSKVHSDVDNVIKAAMDGLNGVAYTDDRIVDEVHGFVFYCDKGDERMVVKICGVEPDNTEAF